jgi:Bardet-Biedl syndrome 2 protein
VAFVGLRDAKPLLIKMAGDGSGTQSAGAGGIMTIRTDNLEVAGDFVQELCIGLGITELESTADFPYDMEEFRTVLMKVDEHNAVRLKLTADVADSSNAVKAFVIKAEDARILTDMNLMRRGCTG